MRTTFLLKTGAIAAACIICASLTQAAVVDLSNSTQSSTAWTGFGPKFNPTWSGEITVIETTPKIEEELDNIFNSSSGYSSAGTCCMASSYYSGGSLTMSGEYRWTVNRVRSSSHASTNVASEYYLDGELYTASKNKYRSGSTYNSASMANYAEIITDDDRYLANASAVAYQKAYLNDRDFSANGRVSAAGILKNGAVSALSDAYGDSCFEVVYSLEKDTAFSFSADLAKLDDVDLLFSAVNNLTGESLWDLPSIESGTALHMEIDGILAAGEYTFSLEASADSLITEEGLQNAGGQAMYDVSLDFDAESYWVPFDFPITISGYNIRGNDILSLSYLSSLSDISVLSSGNIYSTVVSEVPEPGMAFLLFAGLICFGLRASSRKVTLR